MNDRLSDMRVVILAGGLGMRLRSVVSDRPKVLVPIGGKTLLDIVIGNLLQSGFRNIALSVGYMKEKIERHIQRQLFPKDVTISFLEEESPLGTGGAIKKALENFSGNTMLILNGDTFFPIDYGEFVRQHTKHGAEISIGLRQVDNVGRFGGVFIDKNNRILSFKEKPDENNPGNINGGVYIFTKKIFDRFNLPEVFSIEKGFFEKYINRVKVYGFVFPDYFIDMGTPESYKKAQDDFKDKLNQKI